jgi:adenylate cyclase
MNYTVHGDAVNTAARLEQLNKEFGTGTLIAETTANAASDDTLRPIGDIDIRGKTEKVAVYTFK